MTRSLKPREPRRTLSLLLALSLALPSLGVGFVFADEAGPVVYGDGVQKGKVLRLDELMRDSETYLDQVVRVEGTITDVCAHMGCWIEIADETDRSIRFKVKDGVIVFPSEVKGSHARAEGRLRKMEMTGEAAVAWARHEAEERGEEFDPDSLEDPLIVYQLEGIGAEVSPAEEAVAKSK